LTRVVARAAVDATFTPAVELVQEALGATLSDETARRLAERIGAVAEAQTQAAITRARQGQRVWTEDKIARAEDTTILVVEVDGVLVHQEAGWHEMKVGTLAPLGPALRIDPTHGRATLAWGPQATGWAARTLRPSGGGSTWRRDGAAWARRRCAPWSCWVMAPTGSGTGRAPSWACPAWRWSRSWTSTMPTAISGRWATRSMARAVYARRPGSNRSRISSTCTARPPYARRWRCWSRRRQKPCRPSTTPRLTLPATRRAWTIRGSSPGSCPLVRGPWRAPASAWSKRDSNRPACAGASPAVKPSPVCAPCSARGAGRPSGRRTLIGNRPRPLPLRPPRRRLPR